jgi:hypothetical protein
MCFCSGTVRIDASDGSFNSTNSEIHTEQGCATWQIQCPRSKVLEIEKVVDLIAEST